MKNYEVYFEIYGKRMKTTVLAESEESAKTVIRNKVVFHKVILKPKDEFNDIVDVMDSVLDMLGGKKKK